MEKTKEKLCENCKYYLQHYIKINIRLMPTSYGHCIRKKQSGKRVIRPTVVCRLWESVIDKTAEKKLHIMNTIDKMCKRLSDIALILESDINQQ